MKSLVVKSHVLAGLVGLSVMMAGCSLRPAVDDLDPMPAATVLTPDPVDLSGHPDPPPEASPDSDADLWDRVRAGFTLDLDQDNARITAQRNWYARHQNYMDRVATRAGRYLHYIVEQAEERNMPLEMVLLPIVESAFDPFAYSHGRASGPWQFIPSTGRHFGMEQDWWADGRRDIIDSTDAALTYLQQLADRFNGDWLLALASYNAGGGNVNRAITRNRNAGRPTDYWSLRLPQETMAYVPKLLALAQIIRDPEAYGITLLPIPDAAYFAQVDIKGQMDLAQAADLAEVSLEELYMLNPAFNRWATSPNGPHRLLVPVDTAELFAERVEALPPEQRMRWERYTIARGDSLISIANRHQTTPDVLREINRLRGNTIVAGNTLLIPRPARDADSYSLSADARLDARQNRSVSGRQQITHTVRNGDTLWELSRRYRVGVRELAAWNQMAPGDTLRIGQDLSIWTTASASQAGTQTAAASDARNNMVRRINYSVRRGDSLHAIANRFNVSVNQISSWNSLDRNRYLQPGQHLTLYVDIRDAP
ncbi:LysM peptidoglycan-binding domain-containing protein [Alcanivorax limicola]|uniref:LysM peptidoglycan-binding domain-containing protein n=1 Tax=Alcanivorax limicola TaxID=2874102 RepID=UPI001CBD89BF|nr:LysM peptidoglycan-binding domain-containing protein [Alcanivorax limicola]